jgi:hypothetical protein
MSYGGWTPPPPPEAYDHRIAKATDKMKRDQLKRGVASAGPISDIRHEFVTIVVWVATLPWRVVRGVVNVATRPFRRRV